MRPTQARLRLMADASKHSSSLSLASVRSGLRRVSSAEAFKLLRLDTLRCSANLDGDLARPYLWLILPASPLRGRQEAMLPVRLVLRSQLIRWLGEGKFETRGVSRSYDRSVFLPKNKKSRDPDAECVSELLLQSS